MRLARPENVAYFFQNRAYASVIEAARSGWLKRIVTGRNLGGGHRLRKCLAGHLFQIRTKFIFP